MKILVTGTAGFIGFHLVNALLAEGCHISGIDNISSNHNGVALKHARLQQHGITASELQYGKTVISCKHPSYHFTLLDITDREATVSLFQEHHFDIVVHLAAQAGVRYSLTNPHAYTESNITGFLNILEGCRAISIHHLVYASTSSVYGLNTQMPYSPHYPSEHPLSLYAATKKANEMMAHSYSHLFNFPCTGVRFFTVYGPWGRPDMALFLFTEAILQQKPIHVFNNGEMIRDFTYIDDIVNGILHLMTKPATPSLSWNPLHPDPARSSAPYRIVNIGNAHPVNLMDYIAALENALGMKAIKEFLPSPLTEVQATYADVRDLVEEYDYRPAVSIREGVQRFVDWYRGYYLG